jgi:hypothetical protein
MHEEDPFGQEAHYTERGVNDAESQAGWLYFEESLKTESRYFNRAAEDILTRIFAGISEQRTIDGRPIIVEAGPGTELTTLYRARVFQSSDRLMEALFRPDREVGPPPSRFATNGRMNAHGIAVFYGATDALTALAEVRPPVGSNVVVGSFELLRAVRLLDVEALKSVNVEGSVFDRDYIHQREKAKFLEWLSHRITMPVMPEHEPFEYLPTQVVADFLAADQDLSLDGILYPSVQVDEAQRNVVLFHKAARIQELDIPKGTDFSVSADGNAGEGEGVGYYTVYEEVPPEEPPAAVEEDPIASILPGGAIGPYFPEEYDPRVVTLRLNESAVEAHYIKRVTFETDAASVLRRRSEKRKPDF